MAKRSAARNLIEYAALRVALGVTAIAPDPVAHWFAQRCFRTLDSLVPKLRRAARTNLEFAMPQLSGNDRDLVIDGVFGSLAAMMVAFSRFPQIDASNVDRWIRYEGYEHFERALVKGSGVLFATAHMGNWELSAFSHALMSRPMHVVVRPLDNPLIDQFVEQRRSLSGNRIIGKKDYVRSILTALRSNEAVGVLIDQNESPDRGVFVEFFGKKACAGHAFVRLAWKANATVIPGFALWSREEQKYILRFYAPVEMTGDPQADTQALHCVLEQVIRDYPDQWLWIHRRWKTRPEGEPPIYS